MTSPKRLRRLPQGAPLADRRRRIRGGRLEAPGASAAQASAHRAFAFLGNESA